jgi:hypothetical protein
MSMQTSDIQKLIEGFRKSYPFAKVDFIPLLGERLLSRIITEANAGRFTADIYRLDLLRVTELLKRNLFARYTPPEAMRYPKEMRDLEGRWSAHALNLEVLGWNTRLQDGRWVPTFPNARYLFNRTDYDHFKTIDPTKQPGNAAAYRDSVEPIVEAGRADLVPGAHVVDEHLTLEPAPGHTPGTMAITLASRGARAVFCGDILHQAIQVYHPEWNSFACEDAVNARKSRRLVLERCAGSGALLMPTHFGAPFVCRVDAKGDAFVPRF